MLNPLPQLVPSPSPRTTTPNPPHAHTSFATLSFSGPGHLHFFRFPSTLHFLLHATILSSWPLGITLTSKSTSSHGDSVDYKLKSFPWAPVQPRLFGNALTSNDSVIQARRLLGAVFAALYSEGWMIALGTEVSRSRAMGERLLCCFRYQGSGRRRAPEVCEWMSVSWDAKNKLRFVDAPIELCVLVAERLRNLIERQRVVAGMEGVFKIKLKGSVGGKWYDGVRMRGLVLDLLECLEESGWRVYATVEQQVGGLEDGAAESRHCCRVRGWTGGMLVYD
ncbi:hypothetical protein BCR34DRAFT_480746 [Clohesyomyces aquaticus]|uniref:Uncharacterized protein n=1 Tax=Clohesyomyces aquaticus TaxID=1231657 RepID=A0A1Y1ZTR0_9PLEO|nr:hypothetical protein BCR34DRAFT_480746 [Clohesyomyces aquaticus]